MSSCRPKQTVATLLVSGRSWPLSGIMANAYFRPDAEVQQMKFNFCFVAISVCGAQLDGPSAKRTFVQCTDLLRQRESLSAGVAPPDKSCAE